MPELDVSYCQAAVIALVHKFAMEHIDEDNSRVFEFAQEVALAFRDEKRIKALYIEYMFLQKKLSERSLD